jgi:tRNA-dihydrouridine synthase C
MEGVMDSIMRDLLTGIGGYERCVTEFVRVSQTVLPKRVFYRYAPELQSEGMTPSGVPVYVQLLGSDPALMAANARRVAAIGARGIDLNFGCPAKTVNRSRGGAALLRTPDLIRSICVAVRDSVPSSIPVTAKIRLGFDSDAELESIVTALVQAPLSELTIHARTRRQGYRPPAHWHRLREATAQLPFPIIAHGELWSPTDIVRCARISGCNAFMLARGALCRPDLGAAIHAQQSGVEPEHFAWERVQQLLIYFLEKNRDQYDPRYAVNPVKQWLVYLKVYYPQAGALFAKVKRLTDPDEMARLLGADHSAKAA